MNKPEHNPERNPEFSVVTYARNEADVIEGILDQMYAECAKITPNFEIIFVNVPSIDNTFEVATNYANDKPNVFPINLNQVHGDNIQKGYQIALGVQVARGEKIIVTDTDQADPADYKKILDKLDEADVVVGWRKDRKGKHGFLYNFTSWGQNKLTQFLTGVHIHDKNSGIKGFTSRAAKSMVLHGRNFRDLTAQLVAKGFKIDEVVVNWKTREGGIQTFSFIDRLFGGTLDFLANVILIKMNDKPIRFWGTLSAIFTGFTAFTVMGGIISYHFGYRMGFYICLAVAAVIAIFAFISFVVGILMEFIVDKRAFNLADYVLEDPKGVIASRL